MDAMKTHLFFLFFVLVLAFLVGGMPEGGGSAWAQTVSSSRTMSLVKPSSAEDVGLLFYKVSGARPDFGLIIRQTRAYREMNATERMKVLESETGRLSTKFNSLDAKSSVIVIRAAVEMVLTLDPPNKKYTMDIKYPSTGTIFFPYEFSGRPIAVLADGIENFESVALTSQEALKASRHEGRRTVTMVLELKPLSGSYKNPIMLEGARHYPLLAQIGYIGFFSQNMEEVWSWKAPWHTFTGDEGILMLRPTQRSGR